MSETLNETNLTVERNNIVQPLHKQVFGKRSKDNTGKTFFAPEIIVPVISNKEVNGETYQVITGADGIAWVGLDEVISMTNTMLRRIGADICLTIMEENEGVLVLEKVVSEWKDFSAGMEKLSEVEDRMDELQTQQQGYVMDEHFGETNEDGTKTQAALDLEEKMRTVAAQLKPLRIKKATIEAKYDARVKKRQAKKAAEEAAAKASGQPVAA